MAGYEKHTGFKSSIEEFVKRANTVHGGRYDYSLSFYRNSKTPVLIYCFLHGYFKQTPGKHLAGSGCGVCSLVTQGRKRALTTSEFIEKANKIHGCGFYDYSKSIYIKAKNKITITCKTHGDFTMTPNKHLMGQGCRKCGVLRRTDKQSRTQLDFLADAYAVHGSRYNYSNSLYISSHKKITITCKEHGDFLQTPASHLQGIGCAKCGFDLTAWNKTAYVNCAKKNSNSCVYLIRCFNKDESFFKVGITTTRLSYRFKKSKMPYGFEVLSIVTNGAEADWDSEKKLHKALRAFKYKPSIGFGGQTECFSKLTSEVKDFFGV